MRLKQPIITGFALLTLISFLGNAWGENGDSVNNKAKSKKQAKNTNYKNVVLDQLNNAPRIGDGKYKLTFKSDCILHQDATYPTYSNYYDMNLKDVTSYELRYTEYDKVHYYWVDINCKNCTVWGSNAKNDAPTVADANQLYLTGDYDKANLALKGLQKLTKTCGGKGTTTSDKSSRDKENIRSTKGGNSKRNSGEYSVSDSGSWSSDHRMYITQITCGGGEIRGIVKHASGSYGPSYGISGGKSGYKSFEEAARQACGGN